MIPEPYKLERQLTNTKLESDDFIARNPQYKELAQRHREHMKELAKYCKVHSIIVCSSLFRRD